MEEDDDGALWWRREEAEGGFLGMWSRGLDVAGFVFEGRGRVVTVRIEIEGPELWGLSRELVKWLEHGRYFGMSENQKAD